MTQSWNSLSEDRKYICANTYAGISISWAAFRLSDLAGPSSQSLNRTQELPGLFLARMALFMDQSCLILPFRSAKAQEFGEWWRENVRARLGLLHLSSGIWRMVAGKCTRAPWTFPFKLARTRSFRPVRTDKWKTTLVSSSPLISAQNVARISPTSEKLGQTLTRPTQRRKPYFSRQVRELERVLAVTWYPGRETQQELARQTDLSTKGLV